MLWMPPIQSRYLRLLHAQDSLGSQPTRHIPIRQRNQPPIAVGQLRHQPHIGAIRQVHALRIYLAAQLPTSKGILASNTSTFHYDMYPLAHSPLSYFAEQLHYVPSIREGYLLRSRTVDSSCQTALAKG